MTGSSPWDEPCLVKPGLASELPSSCSALRAIQMPTQRLRGAPLPWGSLGLEAAVERALLASRYQPALRGDPGRHSRRRRSSPLAAQLVFISSFPMPTFLPRQDNKVEAHFCPQGSRSQSGARDRRMVLCAAWGQRQGCDQ